MNKYLLVLEYADGGSLYSYLKKNSKKLEWDDKYRLALQLANAIECLHNEDIIHCDLVMYQFIFMYDYIFNTNFSSNSNLIITLACIQCTCTSG
jgi:serine/threonine protein kinase